MFLHRDQSQESGNQDMAASSKFNQATSFAVSGDRHLAENRGTFRRQLNPNTAEFGWTDSGIESGKSEKDYVINGGRRFHRRGRPSTCPTAIASEWPRFGDVTDHFLPGPPPPISECFSTTGDNEIIAIVEPSGKITKLRIITDDDDDEEDDPYETCAEKFVNKLKLDVEIKPKIVVAIKEAISKLLSTLPRGEVIRGNDVDRTQDDEGEEKEDQEKDVSEKIENNFYEVLCATDGVEYAVLENQSDRKKAASVPVAIKCDCGRGNKLDRLVPSRSSNVSELAVVGSCESIANTSHGNEREQTRNAPPPMCCVFVPRSPSPENGAGRAAYCQRKAFPVGKEQSVKRSLDERPMQEDCSRISTFYHRSMGKTEIRNSKRVVRRESVLWTQSSVVQVLGVF